MRPIIISVLVLILCACSKDPKDHSKIKLMIDGKQALSEKAEGSKLPQFNSKHRALMDAVMAACDNRESFANLRKLLETEHKMNVSAEIELEQETGNMASSKNSLVYKTEWKVTVGKGTISCSQSVQG